MFKLHNIELVKNKAVVYFFLLLMIVPAWVAGQIIQYPPIVHVPVTYYDFRSNGTNPEFQVPHVGARYRNMVDRRLKDGKPVRGSSPYLSEYIRFWYRDYKDAAGARGWFKIPKYEWSSSAQNYVFQNEISVSYDTAFKNVVIKDSLPFEHIGGGTYRYRNNNFFPLDNRGFGNEGRSHNYSFTMELKWNFTKLPASDQQQTFRFTGDDDVWAFIDSTLVMDIGGIHGSITDEFNLDNLTSLNLQDRKSYDLHFFFAERHTVASNIEITSNLFMPTVNVSLKAVPSDTVKAGEILNVIASVTDDTSGEWREKEVVQEIKWKLLTDSLAKYTTIRGNFDSNNNEPEINGDTLRFSSTRAYRSYKLQATYVFNGEPKTDTVSIYVIPNDPYRLYIEALQSNMQVQSLHEPKEVSLITIPSTALKDSAFAVARDVHNNFCRLADSTKADWSEVNSSIIKADPFGNKRNFVGIINRATSDGKTYAIVSEPNLISDSVEVSVVNYTILRLRLYDKLTNAIVRKIEIESDSTRDYYVLGLKSTHQNDTNNADAWVPTNVSWTLTPPLISTNGTPASSDKWTFDPKVPGTGNLILKNTSDTTTQVLTIPVEVFRSLAKFVSIRILTPDSLLVAGKTIQAIVEIRNTDGPVPGDYCFDNNSNTAAEKSQITYQDTLKYEIGKRPASTITVDGLKTNLNLGKETSSIKNNQCFKDGLDTINMVLYYAPFFKPDSFHVMTVNLGKDKWGNDRKAESESFKLLPNKLDSLAITQDDIKYEKIQPVVLSLSTNASVSGYSMGYDQYGNYRGQTNTSWNTRDLKPFTDQSERSRFFYEMEKDDQEMNGFVFCVDTVDGKIIKDSLSVKIVISVTISSALTRDLDGDGYLDAVEVTFDKDIESSKINSSFITISDPNPKHLNDNYQIQKINNVNGSKRNYILYLNEKWTGTAANPGPLQTGWLLKINISDNPYVQQGVFTVEDGAPPVIESATKTIYSVTDRSKDKITITFSEKIKKPGGFNISSNDKPIEMLYIWEPVSTDGLRTQDAAVIGINNLSDITENSISFYMINNFDITEKNRVNIRVEDAKSNIVDASNSNTPDTLNRKVTFKLVGEQIRMVTVPNPMTPGFTYEGPGVFNLDNKPAALEWARNGVGSAIVVTLTTKTKSIKASAKIYDIAGNIVNYAKKDNILPMDLDTTQSVQKYYFYWNGGTLKGMKGAPGIYKAVYSFKFDNWDTTFVKAIGLQTGGRQVNKKK
jgi:fibro-slime domain-containing protein